MKAKQHRVDRAGPKVSIGWYGKTDLGMNVWDASLLRVEQLYREFDHVAVLFSAGKDSTAALNVTLEVARRLGKTPLRVIFGDEEVMTPDTVEYAFRVSRIPDVKFEWYCLPWRHRNACSSDSPFWWPWAPESKDVWVRPLPKGAIIKQAGFPMEQDQRIPTTDWNALLVPYRTYGRSALVMGIRAAESQVRRRSLANRKPDPWFQEIDKQPNAIKVYPIYDWSVADVWTAVGKFGWDYNRTYEVFEMLGLSRHNQRIAPPFGEEPRAQLWVWAKAYPELWEKMCDRVPGVQAAARYARTELYSAGKEQPPIHGAAEWRAWIRTLIERQPKPVQAGIAHVLELWIARHYNRTTDPLLDTAAHPDTGMSWSIIALMAEQGDFKKRQRIQPYAIPGSPKYLQQKKEYQEALKLWLAGQARQPVRAARRANPISR